MRAYEEFCIAGFAGLDEPDPELVIEGEAELLAQLTIPPAGHEPHPDDDDRLGQALARLPESERGPIVVALGRWEQARAHMGEQAMYPTLEELRVWVAHLTGKAGEHPEMSYGADAAALGVLLGALEAL